MNKTYKQIKERVELLKAMHLIMTDCNDERAYDEWVYTMVDEPSNDDYWEIAEDTDLFRECCEEFRRILKEYGKHGFYIWDDDAF